MRSRERNHRTGVLVSGLAVLATLVASCAGTRETTDPPVTDPIEVTTEAVSLTPLVERLEAGGIVKAGTSAVISSRVMATVLERRVRAGVRVRRGDVLVVLDARDLSAQARQAEASATGAQQGLVAARSEVTAAAAEQVLAQSWQVRIATLRRQNSATLQELEDADARLAGADARLEASRARLEQAAAGLAAAQAAGEAAAATRSFAVLTAPFDGLVTETLIEPGSLATPGQVLVRLDADGPREVEARLDEGRVALVRVGDQVNVLLGPGVAGETTPVLSAVVKEVAREVDADQRAFTVTVSLSAPEVRTGTFARVQFSGAAREAVTVPVNALRRQGQVATVFVVEGDRARLRYVQTGAASGERVEILAGLGQGERVVTSPPLQLTDGATVAPRGATPAGGVR